MEYLTDSLYDVILFAGSCAGGKRVNTDSAWKSDNRQWKNCSSGSLYYCKQCEQHCINCGWHRAVGKETAAQIAEYVGKTVEELENNRIYGNNRYETSVEIAKTFFIDAGSAMITSGKKAADGLCGGPLATAMGIPMILVKDGDCQVTADYTALNQIDSGYILGGNMAVSDETAIQVFQLENAEDII